MARYGGYDRDRHPGRAPGWGTSERTVGGYFRGARGGVGRRADYGRDYGPRGGGPRGYGRDYGRDFGARGGGGYGPYGQGYGPSMGTGYGAYDPGGPPYAYLPGGWDPTLGWGGWAQPVPYAGWMQGAGMGWGEDDPDPRPAPPRESGTYGRGGDRALRNWARRYGYDVEYEIRPRRRR